MWTARAVSDMNILIHIILLMHTCMQVTVEVYDNIIIHDIMAILDWPLIKDNLSTVAGSYGASVILIKMPPVLQCEIN